jgi:prepilin-type N-terminal cleavage/methylation domain-containing protein
VPQKKFLQLSTAMHIFTRPSLERSHCPVTKNSGFTLFEMLVAVAIIGILAAIAVPSFLGFQEKRKVETGQQMLYQAMRSTQRDAMQFREERRFSVRQAEDHVEWASHPERVSAVNLTYWEKLPSGVVLSERDNTLLKKNGIHYVRFDFRGDVKSRLGTVTLTGANGGQVERCVVVSTLIGAMRKGEGHTTPNSNDRYCY